jgi:DNA-binding GntR family transcriptional regulator
MVHALTVDEWNEIVAMRAVLEPLALRRAAERISGRALATMERIHELMTREEETATWVDMNRRFHRVYYDAAESPRLRSVLTTLHDAATTYVAEGVREQPALPVQGNREHAAIIKGLREQDFNALQSVIATHISTTLSLPHQRPAD